MSISLSSSVEALSRVSTKAHPDSLYVNRGQKIFTLGGYYANTFARITARSIERLTRPMPSLEGSYWKEVGERAKRVGLTVFSIPLAAALFVPAIACYSLAACIGKGRFEHIQPEAPENDWLERFVKVLSLNACFQDPWSPLTGGVVPPFEPVGDCASRVAAVVKAIEQENPVVFMGQEFESLGAQDECIRLLQEKGFRYFLRDLGSNDSVRNNSGLFIASKVALKNVEFVPYPAEDRANLAQWSGQGVLTFTIPVKGRDLRLINVHLNYGEGPENQAARNRQLTRHVVPFLKKGNAALLGDLNFDTASVASSVSGLLGFKNALEGMVTCTDAGKHTLRGKSKNPDGRPCADCKERIDGLIYDPNQIQVLNLEAKPFVSGNQLLSDHFATIATLLPT